jgi:hypothetical protein
MSMILYYSNFCQNCASILPKLSQSQIKSDIHFICIDNRIKKPDGSTYIILSNQKEIIMPPTLSKVPALLLLNRGNQIIYGSDINNHLQPVQTNTPAEKLENVEPDAFSFGDIHGSGVMSDNFSFLDQTIESMSAKGNGGLRQIRNNATLEYVDQIETPPDDYVPNKIGDMSMEKLQQDREKSLS